MPIEIIKQIIDESYTFSKVTRIDTLTTKLKELTNNDEKKNIEAELYETLLKPNTLKLIQEAIHACKEKYERHKDISFRLQGDSFKNKLETLITLIKNPKDYITRLVDDGSDQFRHVDGILQRKLFVEEPKVTISDEFKNKALKTFASVTQMMQLASTLLEHPEFKKDDSTKYLLDRITRRQKEIPIMEHLLTIRLQMNNLNQNTISALNDTVTKATAEWRNIYFEMKDLQRPYLELSRTQELALDSYEKHNLENYGQVADRINNAINTLDKAFNTSKTKYVSSESDYLFLSSSTSSARNENLQTTVSDSKLTPLK